MNCKTSNYSCPYHACMSDECQKQEVLKHHPGFGPGKCETVKLQNQRHGHRSACYAE
jgi:hypothetical protein